MSRKYEDLAGKKFGKLTVIEIDNSKTNRIHWLCQCDCGKITSTRPDTLKTGITQSCGCYHISQISGEENLIGLKYNQLTVIDKSNRKYHWKCLCECGGYREIYTGHLKSNKIKNCGCDKVILYDDLSGQRFTRLLVIELDKSNTTKEAYWICQCDCGKIKSVRSSHLKDKSTTSCGCLGLENRTKHGLTNSKLYRLWADIKTRCYNENKDTYKYYGARGIKLYEEWVDDPKSFIEYISNLENFDKHKYTIDRINVNGNYEPGNLRWTTYYTQAQNRRDNVINMEIAREIRRLWQEGLLKQNEISQLLGIKNYIVYSVINNRSWLDNE